MPPKSKPVEGGAVDFFSCPKKHSIPNEDGCTALQCAREKARMDKINESKRRGIEGKSLVVRAQMTGDRTALDAFENEQREKDLFTYAEARKKFRNEKTGVPSGLKGAEADKWVETEIQNLQPDALAEQKWRLHFGTDEQRDAASRLLLSAGGHGPRDAREGNTAVIILAGVSAGTPKPWSQLKGVEDTIEVLAGMQAAKKGLPEGESR